MLCINWLVIIFCILHTSISFGAIKTNNLHESKETLTSTEGIKVFEDQIEGKTLNNITKSLPSTITLDELSTLVFKKSYQQIIKNKQIECQALLFQKYPGKPNFYIGIGALRASDWSTPLQIFITTFKIPKPHSFEIISQCQKPYTFSLENLTNIEGFDPEYQCDQFIRFDGARYQISPEEFAFGLRLAHNEGYAGGFAQFHNLILFTLKNKTVTPVLNIPIFSLEEYAGDWHEDGTREHFVTEREWVLCVTEKKQNEHFNVQVKQKKANTSYQLAWNSGKYTLVNRA